MIFKQQSYSGKIFRPKPEVFFEPEHKMLIIATPWGPKSAAKKVIEYLREHYLTSKTDLEVTSPFEYLTCLSLEANHLRRAIMLTNDLLYQEDNREEYTAGVELFALVGSENSIVWTQIGQPQLIVERADQTRLFFGAPTDLQIKIGNKKLDPIPSHLLGLASTSHFFINSLQISDGDSLVMISRSVVPTDINQATSLDIDGLSQILVEDSASEPFWVGQLHL